MTRETTYAGRIEDIRRLNAALADNQEEIAHLEGARQRLDSILGRSQEVSKRQAALKASKQELSQQLKQLVTEGQRVAHAVRSLLKEHYGSRAEKLAEFGIQPFRGRPRKVKPEVPELPPPTISQ
jgi:hypothetical protein